MDVPKHDPLVIEQTLHELNIGRQMELGIKDYLVRSNKAIITRLAKVESDNGLNVEELKKAVIRLNELREISKELYTACSYGYRLVELSDLNALIDKVVQKCKHRLANSVQPMFPDIDPLTKDHRNWFFFGRKE